MEKQVGGNKKVLGKEKGNAVQRGRRMRKNGCGRLGEGTNQGKCVQGNVTGVQ